LKITVLKSHLGLILVTQLGADKRETAMKGNL